MPRLRIAVVRGPDEGVPEWERGLSAAGVEIDRAAGPDAGPAPVAAADCLVVDGGLSDALHRLGRVHRTDPACQAVVVAPADERARLERALLFVPGLGEVWIVSPPEVDPRLVERAAEVTRRRRRFARTRGRVERDLAAIGSQSERRAVVSDAYLAAVLDAAPDPVLSVDQEGRVLSWNPGSERVLGHARKDAMGRPLRELLDPPDERSLSAVEEALRNGPSRAVVRFRRSDGELGAGELIVMPVEAGGLQVRAVLIHDRTEAQQAQEELEAQASELEMLNEELQARTAELTDALSARARFYAAMSHELRTPINAILGYQDLILSGVHGELTEEQTEAIERAQRATRHLVELVNDVLDLAKIEAGRVEVQLDVTRFPLLVDELLDTVRALAQQHDTSIRVTGPRTHEIESDPRRVRQILLNLLSNAIKFGEGKPIEVEWTPTADGGVRVAVRDRGQGVDPADSARIFEEFVQVGTGGAGGTGLGLPISRRLAELLGGRLEVESEPGKGSTFTLTLPARAPQAAVREERPASSEHQAAAEAIERSGTAER